MGASDGRKRSSSRGRERGPLRLQEAVEGDEVEEEEKRGALSLGRSLCSPLLRTRLLHNSVSMKSAAFPLRLPVTWRADFSLEAWQFVRSAASYKFQVGGISSVCDGRSSRDRLPGSLTASSRLRLKRAEIPPLNGQFQLAKFHALG